MRLLLWPSGASQKRHEVPLPRLPTQLGHSLLHNPYRTPANKTLFTSPNSPAQHPWVLSQGAPSDACSPPGHGIGRLLGEEGGVCALWPSSGLFTHAVAVWIDLESTLEQGVKLSRELVHQYRLGPAPPMKSLC